MDQSETQPWGEPRPKREPVFNAPWIVLVLCLGLIALFEAQTLLYPSNVYQDGVPPGAALSRASLAAGHWQTLFTSMFLHGGWMHVLTNSIAALAFAPPVARLLGQRLRGTVVFVTFYLFCGAVAGLGFVATDFSKQPMEVVGASGAISGLIGAAARIIQGRGRVGPLFGRQVISMTVTWSLANVVLGVSGLTLGANMPVAWQAHLFGYAAGVLSIGAFARLAGRGGTVFTQ